MAKSARERQAKRRESLKGQYGLGIGFSMVLDEDARYALERLCLHYGKTKAGAVRDLIIEADNRVIRSLLDDSVGRDRYMSRDTSRNH
ncbi:MAG: hypothetical protein ACP5OS_07085 [Leptospirillia bacterium]